MDVRELDDHIAASAAVRRRFEPDAYMNIAFLEGRQWVRWDATRLFDVQVDSWRESVVDNRIKPFVRTELAKMTKTRPKFVGVPKSQSDQDVQSARYAEMALDDAWKTHGLQRKLRAALLWSRVAFIGYWKIWWDPELGPKRDILVYGQDHPNAGRLVRDNTGAPWDPKQPLPEGIPGQKQSVARGDICVDLRSFFHVFPDPGAGEEGLEGCEWVGEEAIYSRGWFARHFPRAVDSVSFDQDPSPGMMESRLPISDFRPMTTEAGKGIKVRELWSADKHYVWTDQTVLVDEDNPYPWLPYVGFYGTPVPGRFYPGATVTDLRPQQIQLNIRRSQIADNANRIANPPLMVPSTMADEFDWQGDPGEQIVYLDTGTPNAMPSFLGVPSLPSYVENDVDRTQQALMEISGNHEVSQAQVPAGVTAASAISLLQEQDDTRLGPDIASMERSLEEAGRRVLWLMRRYYTEERHLRIAGEDGQSIVQAFKADTLEGTEDIDVQAGSAMPESKAARQAAIQQFATMFSQNNPGAITPRGWARIMSEIGVGGIEAFFAQLNRDKQQCDDEDRRISQGEGLIPIPQVNGTTVVTLPINPFDNDNAHVEFHEEFEKTSSFRALAPPAQQAHLAHVQLHRDRKNAAAAQMNQPPAGIPGGNTAVVNGETTLAPSTAQAPAGPPTQGT
jgi:hypothetical protein